MHCLVAYLCVPQSRNQFNLFRKLCNASQLKIIFFIKHKTSNFSFNAYRVILEADSNNIVQRVAMKVSS